MIGKRTSPSIRDRFVQWIAVYIFIKPSNNRGLIANSDGFFYRIKNVLIFQSYLSGKGLVHRDLAARNVLVGHGKRLKIADFGLMREVYHEVYEVQKQKKLPVKWMAPESLYEQIFTSKSDVLVTFSRFITVTASNHKFY